MEDFNDPVANSLDRVTRRLDRKQWKRSRAWRHLRITALRGRIAPLPFAAKREVLSGFINARSVAPLLVACATMALISLLAPLPVPLFKPALIVAVGAIIFIAMPFAVAWLRCVDTALSES